MKKFVFVVEEEVEVENQSSESPVPEPFGSKRAGVDIFNPRLSAVLNKCKVSDRNAVHLLTACIDPSKFVTYRSSIRL